MKGIQRIIFDFNLENDSKMDTECRKDLGIKKRIFTGAKILLIERSILKKLKGCYDVFCSSNMQFSEWKCTINC